MSLLITNIKELVQVSDSKLECRKGLEMDNLPSIKNAWIYLENEVIGDFGSMNELESKNFNPLKTIDATGKFVLPTYVDSHTHIVFAKTRESEFVDRINGLSYEEIALRGGGILNSAKKLNNCSEQELFESSSERLNQVIKFGTGAIEIKSGYGLTFENELKMLRVATQLKEKFPIQIKRTFLGAHAFPKDISREKYLSLIIDEMIPAVASEKLAEYIDAFCETNYFTVSETEKVINAGLKYGLKPKIHVNQFTSIGGIQKAVELGAISVDHLEEMTQKDIDVLSKSNTIPTLLPSCSFFLSIPFAPAKELMKNNLPVALATDYNPGSTPSGNMNFVISLACIKMKMTPNQAFNAATINGAAALELASTDGSITKGKVANLIITNKMESLAFIPYSFGTNQIDKVIIKGEEY